METNEPQPPTPTQFKVGDVVRHRLSGGLYEVVTERAHENNGVPCQVVTLGGRLGGEASSWEASELTGRVDIIGHIRDPQYDPPGTIRVHEGGPLPDGWVLADGSSEYDWQKPLDIKNGNDPRDKPLDPAMPRRFRWKRIGRSKATGFGMYIPGRKYPVVFAFEESVPRSSSVGDYKSLRENDMPSYTITEWIDPAPEGTT